MDNVTITGIASPAHLDPSGDWATASDAQIIRSDVGDLLGTICATVEGAGEVPWDGDRGSQLPTLRHRNVHLEYTRALAEQLALGALARYEKRVQPTAVVVDFQADTGQLNVHVGYVPRIAGEHSAQTATVVSGA